MEGTGLSGMKAIQEHCRILGLPASEVTVIQMIRQSGFPARKLGGIWLSDKERIQDWQKRYISGELTPANGESRRKKSR
jgi:hypothetical protein